MGRGKSCSINYPLIEDIDHSSNFLPSFKTALYINLKVGPSYNFLDGYAHALGASLKFYLKETI